MREYTETHKRLMKSDAPLNEIDMSNVDGGTFTLRYNEHVDASFWVLKYTNGDTVIVDADSAIRLGLTETTE